ncbi:heme exporter protein C [bacterium BMS3Abin02]|nr:heme exporter protein C [bacterium BMS3Abin02]GBE20963.1 heme exporter protein C [bacterium BMS3Bbin01]
MKRSVQILSALAVVGVAVGLTFGITAPIDEFQGIFQKIMYVHVPSAWLAFVSFGVVLVAGIGYLVTKKHSWDRVAASSAEMGVFFTATALITGMLWGRPVWGTFWDWGDARLVLTALILVTYLGYLALRRSIADPDTRARRAAVLGIIAFVQVPLIHFSVTWWRTLHQTATVLRPETFERAGNPSINPLMLRALMVNLGTFTLIYLAFMVTRVWIAQMADAVEEREANENLEIAGAGITAPILGGDIDD